MAASMQKGVKEITSKMFIELNAGDPDFEAPKWVKDAATNAIKKGGVWTHHARMQSKIPWQFQEAVVDYYKKFGPIYNPKEVIPTAGSSIALYIALKTILDPGDEIFLWEPSYKGYYYLLRDMGVKMSVAPLKRKYKYHPDLDTLEDYINPKTKAVLLCNPNNPTGTVFTKKELRAIGDLVIDHDITLLSDEIYLHFVYDNNKFISIASLDGLRDRTINIMSLSKTFSMTGWRLGYLIVPEKYLPKTRKITSMVAPWPATFIYHAGVAALRGSMSYVEELRQVFDERRKYFCKAIDDIDVLSCHLFEGSYYGWFDARKCRLGSQEFTDRLEKKENVALSPGHTNGLHTDGFIRVPLVQPVPILKQVVDRLDHFVHSL